MRAESSKGYCVGLGSTVRCIHTKHSECACRHAHPCALARRAKTVVRRGRKASRGLLCMRGSRAVEQKRRGINALPSGGKGGRGC